MKTSPIYKSRESIRLKNYDYSLPGAYFVTICLKEGNCYFNKSCDQYSHTGKIITELLKELPRNYSNIQVDEYIIMPDHIHLILMVKEVKKNFLIDVEGVGLMNQTRTIKERKKGNEEKGQIKEWRLMKNPKPVIGKFIRAFKAKATRLIRESEDENFQWHRNYYERIIRNERELLKFRRYIRNNKFKV